MTNAQANAIRLFAFTFCVTSAYMINRIVGDSALLARLGPDILPIMLVFSALIVGIISYIWAHRSQDVSLAQLLYQTQIGVLACTVLLAPMLHYFTRLPSVIGSVYVLAELRGCFNLILISTLLNEHFCSQTETGRYAFVNAGSPVAGIAMGVLLGLKARAIPPAYLLASCCVLDIIAIAIGSRVISKGKRIAARELPTYFEPGVVNPDRLGKPGIDRRIRRFVRALMIVIVSKTIVMSIVSFEWKVVADRALGHDERSLARYFGLFYAVSDGLILFIQLTLTRQIIQKLGIRMSLLLLPFALVGSGVVSLFTDDVRWLLVAVTVARGSMVVRRSIHDVSVQLVYGAMPKAVRRGVVARILGIAKPVAEAGAAGGVALLAGSVPTKTFAWFWMPFLAVWIYSTLHLGRAWERVSGGDG